MKIFKEKTTALKQLSKMGATQDQRKEFEQNGIVRINGELICLERIFNIKK